MNVRASKPGLLSFSAFVGLFLVAVIVIVPIYWMVIASFKPQSELFSLRQTWSLLRPTLGNYKELFSKTHFARWLGNSLLVTGGTTLLGLFFGSMAGFAFAKYEFRMKGLLFWLLLSSVTVPQIVTIIPVFAWLSRLGLTDTYFALVVPPSINVFAVFLMKQYIAGVPDELLESARIDGLSEFGIYYRIVLPVVRPGLGAAGIFLSLGAWSSYLWPLIMAQSSNMLTIPVGLATLYSNPWDLNYGMLMAGAVVSTVPVLLAFLLMQEQFIAGLTQGAVKG